MIRSKYLTIIAITLIAVINIIATVSCDNIATIVTTTKKQIASSVTVAKEQTESLSIGIVQGIYCTSETSMFPYYAKTLYIAALIQPTYAKANTIYAVSLYEGGVLRQTSNISWSQPEINIKKSKLALFNATDEEFNVYSEEYGLPWSYTLPEGLATQYEAVYPRKSLPSTFSATIKVLK